MWGGGQNLWTGAGPASRIAGCLSGQKDLTVNQTRKLRGFESLTCNMNPETQLEISERAGFWQLRYEHLLTTLINQGFSENTARVVAQEQADMAYKIRFPHDYN